MPDSSAMPPGGPVTPDLRGRGPIHHAPAEDAHGSHQSRSSGCRRRQARTEYGRETGVSLRFGRAGLALLLAILEEVFSPGVGRECGRARWLP